MIYYKVKPVNEDFYAIQYTGSNKDEVWLFIERFWPETYEVEERKYPEEYCPEIFIVYNSRHPVIASHILKDSYILRTPDNVLSLINKENIDSFYKITDRYEDFKIG